MLAAWPLYLTMILMAPALLSAFGERYQQAQDALVILGAAMLIATAVGPVDMVLLMAGKSAWNLANTVIALTTNVVLNLLLIPGFGIKGAAAAWGASIVLNNILPLVQVRRFVGIHPFGPGVFVAGSIALASFGLTEIAVRAWIGDGIGPLVVAGVVGGVVLLAMTYVGRRSLNLVAFRDAARRPRVAAG
jgi:O-antigen/teichoic acid export membrane protein